MTPDILLAEIKKERERLRKATSIRGVLGVRKRATSLVNTARTEHFAIAIENAAFELKVLSERELGCRLPKTCPRGGDRRSLVWQKHRLIMKDFGITYKQSERFRRVATIPIEVISSYIVVCTAAFKRVSTNQLLRLL